MESMGYLGIFMKAIVSLGRAASFSEGFDMPLFYFQLSGNGREGWLGLPRA